MKKVCLVKGGNFVLGIEDRYILSRQQGLLPREVAGNGEPFFHLGSLLARNRCDRPEPGSVFLRLHTKKQTFFLLVDQIIDEIDLPEQTTRLPPPSPDLATQLFPQVAICMNLVVLLLDPTQVMQVAQQLGQGIGMLAAEHCLQDEKQVQIKQVKGGRKAGPPVFKKQIRRDKKRPKSVNEETFKRVMAWTIAQFKQGKVSPEDLAADRLPPGLIQQEGLSDTVIQYLIDQISLRCQESITPSRPGERHGG
ncbi:MAG: hypothetical protein SD837_13095 [Candidatus Electrothrix scaldis]|nr:MAG: hypothetical protein SD837_13095 [Candidatus Electrothrix sp. GW3-3]